MEASVGRLRIDYFVLLTLVFLVLLLPKIASELVYVLLAMIGGVSAAWRLTRFAIWCIAAFLYLLFVAAASYQFSIGDHLFLVEAKIIVFPLVCLFFTNFSPTWRVRDPVGSAIWLLIILNVVWFFGSGFQLRYIDHLKFGSTLSIYMGTVTAIACLLSKRWSQRLLLIALTLLSGSGAATGALIAGYITKYYGEIRTNVNIKTALLALVSVLLLIFFLQYNYYARGRDLLDFQSIDRYQLGYAGVNFMIDAFDFSDWMVGYGVGRTIDAVYGYFPAVATVIPWLAGSRAQEGFTGLVFHNEFLRLIFNFGLVGSTLVIFILWGALKGSKPTLVAVLVASLTSSTVYVSSLIVFVLLFSQLQRAEVERMNARSRNAVHGSGSRPRVDVGCRENPAGNDVN